MRAVQLLVALLMAGALFGCGGGGGAADGNGGPPPSVVPAKTGLIPDPPAQGKLLFQSVDDLRPFMAGAVWRYRGTQIKAPGAEPVYYDTETTHSDADASGVTERTSNAGNGNVSDTYRVERGNGVVSFLLEIDATGNQKPGLIEIPELSAPVREGDQHVAFDQRLTETAIDVDGDRRPDAVDLAVYLSVRGIETVSPPNLPPLQALRVDLIVQSRVLASGTGLLGPVVQSVISTWYVPGVGPVRQRAEFPAELGGYETTDEVLVSWRGQGTGLGAMPSQQLMIPSSNPVFPNQGVPLAEHAYAIDGHVLLLAMAPGDSNSTLAARIGPDGAVVSARLIPGYRVFGTPMSHKQGVAFLRPEGNITYRVVRLDREGGLVGPVEGVLLDLSGSHQINSLGRYAIGAIDEAGVLWILFLRDYRNLPAPPEQELVLRAYAEDGSIAHADRVVHAGAATPVAISAGGGKISMMWSVDQGGTLVMGRTGSQGAVSTATFATALTGQGFPRILRYGDADVVIWPGNLGGGNTTGTSSGGVVVGADLMPLRAGSDWPAEQLPWMPIFSSLTSGPLLHGDRLVVVDSGVGRLWPSDSSDTSIGTVGWIDIGTGPLAAHPPRSLRFAAAGRVDRYALLPDRLLVFEPWVGGGLASRVVWLPGR